MRFGVRLIQYLGSPRALVDLGVLAEQAGIEQVWFPHDAFMLNSWALTVAAAERTSRIAIGSVGTNPYTADPSEVATYVATLDLLSGGRALLGLGLHTREMVGWTGHDASDAEERTAEAVELVRRLLRGEVAEHDGRAFRWGGECYLRFEPLRAEIPVYVACFGESFLRRSGAIGDGSLPMITPPESAGLMAGRVRAGAESAGRDPGEVDVAGCAWLSLSESGEEARALMRRMIAYFGPYLERPALATVGLAPEDFAPIKALVDAGRYDEADAAVRDDMLRLAIAGTPDQVAERIGSLADSGITQVNLGGPLGPDPAEALRLLGDRVLPAFR